MVIAEKKISKEARRNELDKNDLRSAVQAIQAQKDGKYEVAQAFKEVVHEEGREVWEIAGDIVQFLEEQKSTC